MCLLIPHTDKHFTFLLLNFISANIVYSYYDFYYWKKWLVNGQWWNLKGLNSNHICLWCCSLEGAMTLTKAPSTYMNKTEHSTNIYHQTPCHVSMYSTTHPWSATAYIWSDPFWICWTLYSFVHMFFVPSSGRKITLQY